MKTRRGKPALGNTDTPHGVRPASRDDAPLDGASSRTADQKTMATTIIDQLLHMKTNDDGLRIPSYVEEGDEVIVARTGACGVVTCAAGHHCRVRLMNTERERWYHIDNLRIEIFKN